MTAFDLPGHGRSAGWDGQGEIQGITTRIAATFPDGPWDIIGHSFGATVALRLAVERPELVRSLVLIEPVLFAVALRDDPATGAAFEAGMGPVNDAMRAGRWRAAARAFVAIWGAGAPWPDIPEAQKRAMAGQMPLIAASQAALHDDVADLLAPGRIAAVAQPALLIEGALSPDIIGAVNAGLAARLPRAERAMIEGAGHMAPITHPGAVARVIQRFLRRV